MKTDYEASIIQIKELVTFLESVITIRPGSYLERDYILACSLVEAYQKKIEIPDPQQARSALCGLLELRNWIWLSRKKPEFEKIIPHLDLLSVGAPRINEYVQLINPTTGQQDQYTNKVFEIILGLFAIVVGNNVELDDPSESSGGKNPDVIFDFFGKRISIACKTLRGNKPENIRDNFVSAAKQIERCECDFGYFAVNPMNIIDHNLIGERIYDNQFQVVEIVLPRMENLYADYRRIDQDAILNTFKTNKKIRASIVTLIHTSANIDLGFGLGYGKGSIKATLLSDLCIPGHDTIEDQILSTSINNFIHHQFQ